MTEGVIHVRRSWDAKSKVMVAPKSKTSVRDVPMTSAVRAALAAHSLRTARRAGLVFGRDGEHPFSHSATLSRAKDAWKKAKIPVLACGLSGPGGEARAAGVRRDRASRGSALLLLHPARRGVSVANVSRDAGHDSPAFTLAKYVHARTDQGGSDAGKFDAYLEASAA